MGIEFRLNTTVGVDVSFDSLLERIRCGIFSPWHLHANGKVALVNEQAPGVYEALPYLIGNVINNCTWAGTTEHQFVDLKGKNVVVLGGGDTAMDCVRTAIRQGASKVICAYRRDEANMPGSRKEVQNAREEGVEFMFNLQPLRY